MSANWISLLVERSEHFGAVVRVSVIDASGSTPRDVGAWMLVLPGSIENTIGGGRLEFEAINIARKLLEESAEIAAPWQRQVRKFPLGPGLGQCCGGSVSLLFEIFTQREFRALRSLPETVGGSGLVIRPTVAGAPMMFVTSRKDGQEMPVHIARIVNDMLSGARPTQARHIKACKDEDGWFIEPVRRKKIPLYIYGAGHVGRAIVGLVDGLSFDVVWVDTTRARFPDEIPSYVTPAIHSAPDRLARNAEPGAFHLVLTYSHTLDLAICHNLLARGDFAFLGLIGSETKRARFLKRLRESGISEAALGSLTCPIGITGIRGKEPATIAISVVAQLIERFERAARELNQTEFRREHV